VIASFRHRLHRPGHSPPVVALILGEDEYHLRVPDPYALMDLAAAYNWTALIPGALTGDGPDRIAEHLADPDHKLTSKRLHVAVQPLGTYLYGWPFYIASRALRLLRFHEATFRCWALLNVALPVDAMSAADWTAASIAWQMSMNHKEEERNAAWAELTVPGRLPMDAPGVTPDWMRGSD
jgi:hypothetical protein